MRDKFVALANTFPTIAARNVTTVAEVRRIYESVAGDSETMASAAFLMSVWNYVVFDERFSIGHAWHVWDAEHRAAWKAWAADPWWA